MHFAQVAPRVDRLSPQGAVEWAAGLTAHNTLLRGGEVGTTDTVASADIDINRIITWSSLEWKSPCPDSQNRPWLVVWVVPIKDASARKKAHPIPISRSHQGTFGDKPLCTYDALVRAWWLRRVGAEHSIPLDPSGVPVDEWWRTPPMRAAPPLDSPFFTLQGGEIYRSADVRELVRKWATLIDLPPLEFTSRAFRVAGATDIRERIGDEEKSKRLIKDRGRWESDIGAIYSRPLVAPQLAASASVSNATGAGFEDIFEGFAQPARG